MVTRRTFLKAAGITGIAAFGSTLLAACGNSEIAASSSSESAASDAESSDSAGERDDSAASKGSPSAAASSSATSSDSVVVYFSRAGENYLVGNVKQGNTAIVANIVAKKTGSDVFRIKPVKPYPKDFDECLDAASDERNSDARPAYSGDLDLTPYKTVYLGYPLWWRDLPTCVYTFLESHDWHGKKIRPFCTHGGMGLMDTVSSIANTCTGATVAEGLSIEGTTAHRDHAAARSAVNSWL